MSVHFDISPPMKPLKVPSFKLSTVEETPCLSLSCFAPNVKLDFENVIVGTTSTQQILIKNPSEHNIKVSVINLPPAEQGVTVNWHSQLIQSHDTITFEISWKPLTEGSWRHTFKFEDGHRIKKSISVVFKSIIVSKKTGSHNKAKRTVLARNGTRLPTYQKSSKLDDSKFASKENVDPNYDTFVISSSNSFTINCVDNQFRRETYTINSVKPLQENRICIEPKNYDGTFTITPIRQELETSISKDFSDDSLEVQEKTQISFVKKRSPLVYNRNSTYVLTPDKRGYNSFSPRSVSSTNKPLLLCETALEEEYVLTPDKREYNNFRPRCSSSTKKTLLCEATIHEEPSANLLNQTTKLKRKSNFVIDISPSKRLQLDERHNRPYKTWSKSKQLSKTVVNPYLLTVDPFLSTCIYYESNWINEQEERFKKWLNCLLTPPAELHSNTEAHTVDAAKLWQECKNKHVDAPLTKEIVSSQYHINNRLDSLRISAKTMYKSSEISTVLSKTHAVVDSEKLCMRTDRNIHANIGLQGQILTLLFCYNPLWLRIGLETVFNTTLLLASNSDIMGLTNFIMQHFFKDPALIRKHKSVYTPKYILAIKQFVLKQFLSLVYFLDVAKTKGLIAHDPCLFCKNAPHKESRAILFGFARDLIAAVGDITRFLKRFGYIVVHEQKYIHEIDYSVIHLGSDLQDGVRLTKVMEIILVQTGLVDKLRVPAISKLQKVHNVEIIFTALAKANFTIVGDIVPKDIVQGHREKTLSFLWQIIYKFQAPILIKAATKIQSWWRNFPIAIKRRILNKPHKAATKIQNYFKMRLQQHRYSKMRAGALVIQAFTRMSLLRNAFIRKRVAAITIQQRYRSYKLVQLQRADFLKMKKATILIQRRFRMKRLERAALIIQRRYRAQRSMRIAQADFVSIKAAALCIQHYFRIRKEIKFAKIRKAAITIQQRFRAKIIMRTERSNFLALRNATMKLQRRYRATQAMQIAYLDYQSMKSAAMLMQQRFRANKAMKLERSQYLLLKQATIATQQRFRANQLQKIHNKKYCHLRDTTIMIQRRFRANKAMIYQRSVFIGLKKAALTLQEQFRAQKAMKIERNKYRLLKQATITVQQRFRANKTRTICYKNYQKLRASTIIIQRRFRANKAMKIQCYRYLVFKQATITIQQRFRANLMRKIHYTNYHRLQVSTITIQRRFRANKAMKVNRSAFICLKEAALKIQRRFRANKAMQLDRSQYVTLKQMVMIVQQRYRANRKRTILYNKYHSLKNAAVIIQRRFRAIKAMKHNRSAYIALKESVLMIQHKFRANKAMKLEKHRFCSLKQATVRIQQRFRANQARKQCYNNYHSLRDSTIIIQRRFRANKKMKHYRSEFVLLRTSVLKIQQRFRANFAMKIDCLNYEKLRRAAIVIQQRFRANKIMKFERFKFVCLRQVVLNIQHKFRANRDMKKCYASFHSLKSSTIAIQRCFRANKAMQSDRLNYCLLKQAALTIQHKLRANLAMNVARREYQNMKFAVVTIQRRYRANKAMKLERLWYTSLQQATINIQQRFRANRAMQQCCKEYQDLKRATVTVQQRFRALKEMRNHRSNYILLKHVTITIQQRYRANKAMQPIYLHYQKLRHATILVQQRFRANIATRIDSQKFIALQNATSIIQRQFRRFRVVAAERKRFVTYRNSRRAAAIKIQAFWRGYRVRVSHPEMCKIRKNAIEINLLAQPQNTLGVRKEQALQLLYSDNPTLLHIISALADLDYITRRCKQTCLNLSQILPDLLYLTIRSGNRSLPDMRASAAAAGILINFYKYPPTSKLAWIPKHMENIFTILIHCSDKEDKLFLYLCTLVWLFAHNEEYRIAIHSIPNFKLIMYKIKTLCERKQKMVGQQRHFNILSIFLPYWQLPEPSQVPDWGLEYPEHPRLFTNARHAFKCLVDILGCK